MVRGVPFLWVVHVSPVWLRHGCLNSHPSWLSSPFLLLKTSPILEKSYLFLSVCLSKKFPPKNIFSSLIYMAPSPSWEIYFFFPFGDACGHGKYGSLGDSQVAAHGKCVQVASQSTCCNVVLLFKIGVAMNGIHNGNPSRQHGMCM